MSTPRHFFAFSEKSMHLIEHLISKFDRCLEDRTLSFEARSGEFNHTNRQLFDFFTKSRGWQYEVGGQASRYSPELGYTVQVLTIYLKPRARLIERGRKEIFDRTKPISITQTLLPL
jgi:hypothetical protein